MGNVLVMSHFQFQVSMVTHFRPKCKKCSKMGSECQIFASLKSRIIIFTDMKRIIKLNEIPRNGYDRCIEIAPSDL